MDCRHALFSWASPEFSLNSFSTKPSRVLLIPHPNFILGFPKAPLSYLSDPHSHRIIWKFIYYLWAAETQIYPFIPDLALFQTKLSACLFDLLCITVKLSSKWLHLLPEAFLLLSYSITVDNGIIYIHITKMSSLTWIAPCFQMSRVCLRFFRLLLHSTSKHALPHLHTTKIFVQVIIYCLHYCNFLLFGIDKKSLTVLVCSKHCCLQRSFPWLTE